MDDLNANLIYLKQHVLKNAINRAAHKKVNIIKRCHLKKFNALLDERNQTDGIASDPNNIITNLLNHTLSND